MKEHTKLSRKRSNKGKTIQPNTYQGKEIEELLKKNKRKMLIGVQNREDKGEEKTGRELKEKEFGREIDKKKRRIQVQ